MDGMSLEQVVELLDKNLVELSPVVANGDTRRLRHSTPEMVRAGVKLELVGKGMKTHVKAGTTLEKAPIMRTAGKTQTKSATRKTRNYNTRNS